MALASNALATVDEFVQALDIPDPSGDPVKLASTQLLINAASDYAEDYCDRTFLSGSVETEFFIGQGYNDLYDKIHKSHKLKQAPITSTPVLYEEQSDGTYDAVDTSLYTYDSIAGELYFYSTNIYYFEKDQRYKVLYESGYDGVANIPYDLKHVCIVLAGFNRQRNQHLGVESQDDKTYTLDIPKHIFRVLDKYKRP